MLSFQALIAEVKVNSLKELQTAVQKSGQEIKMVAGQYDLGALSEKSRSINFSGSNNTIDLTGVSVTITVGTVRTSYLVVSGNNNTIIGGEFEDVYKNGLKEITDFSAYNQDRKHLARGLRGAAVMNIEGHQNTVKGIKLTVRGSYPYGYGSIYGIGADNVYGLDKRCGILIKGVSNTLDNVEVQQRAFGHGIYMQGDADKTLIKNSLVEGRLRKSSELYQETAAKDLPNRSNYSLPLENNAPIPKDKVHSLAEDGIRMYKIPGSITVENCTVKKMRGGIRLYLGGPATVKNSTAIDCGMTNWNLPSNGKVQKSSGNFAYSPLSDFRLKRSRTAVDWTIIPSPHAIGSHNLMDLQGNNHHIILNRAKGPIDTNEKRAIVITGKNSTIINNTEYTIILEKSSTGNNVKSYGPVTDKGDNKVSKLKTLSAK